MFGTNWPSLVSTRSGVNILNDVCVCMCVCVCTFVCAHICGCMCMRVFRFFTRNSSSEESRKTEYDGHQLSLPAVSYIKTISISYLCIFIGSGSLQKRIQCQENLECCY